jgi:glycosyltransferase involved in cell wall biosynthesis
MPGKASDQILAEGIIYHELPLTRSGKNPLLEFQVFIAIFKLFRKLKPAIVHLVTIKPVIYGGIAARLTDISGVVAAVSGLGFVFIAKGFKASIVRLGVKSLYRLAFGKKNLCVIFQNSSDRSSFVDAGILAANKTVLIRGSGVDMEEYPTRIEPDGRPVIIMASRLLRDKGVTEFVGAARILKQRGLDARFLLAGEPDPDNPATITAEELEMIREDKIVELLGHRKDIAELFASSNIVVLPSYREGLPRVLVEAAAAGRAVVTTDVPGCRDAIESGVTGLLVPVRDTNAIADAVQKLIEDVKLRQHMGYEGRRLAEKEFSIEKIMNAHMEIYRMLEARA